MCSNLLAPANYFESSFLLWTSSPIALTGPSQDRDRPLGCSHSLGPSPTAGQFQPQGLPPSWSLLSQALSPHLRADRLGPVVQQHCEEDPRLPVGGILDCLQDTVHGSVAHPAGESSAGPVERSSSARPPQPLAQALYSSVWHLHPASQASAPASGSWRATAWCCQLPPGPSALAHAAFRAVPPWLVRRPMSPSAPGREPCGPPGLALLPLAGASPRCPALPNPFTVAPASSSSLEHLGARPKAQRQILRDQGLV